uniref:ATP-sensitive inward rectifier potassium channel 12-like n=1 Tax=Saccoglossus kowalevskii TaxID=10224 RepID=A0ABM0GUW2_SACKO
KLIPAKIKRRCMDKDGKCQPSFLKEYNRTNWRYLYDMFTTSVDMPWRYNLLMVSGVFLLSWLIFGILYYLIAIWRGDFKHIDDVNWKPCFRNFINFKSAFLYSMETQTTIGYGYRSPTEHCEEAILLALFQVIFANFFEAFIISSFLAKISRPKLRASTLIFSKTAIISEREGNVCFMFRIADLRRSQIVEGHVRLLLLKHHVTEEGEVLPLKMYDMDVGHSTGLDRVFLVWPYTVTHIIDSKSPLHEVSKEIMENSSFEIIVILEGIVEATGTTTQARTSYINDEIRWGHRFEEVLHFNGENFDIDMDRFHKTYSVHTPRCSAKDLYANQDNHNRFDDSESESDYDPRIIKRWSLKREPVVWQPLKQNRETRI